MAEITEKNARNDGLPPGAFLKQQRGPRGGTSTSLKKLKQGKHPQHGCTLLKIRPLRHKVRRALETNASQIGDEELDDASQSQLVIAQDDNRAQPQNDANFQSSMSELEELEQQAFQAAGMDLAPEEEDMFCSVGW